MHPYFLAIPLPRQIRLRLASFCYGLPQVRWVEEENFHLTLRHLGIHSSDRLIEIQELLRPIFFHPFSLVLQGIGHSHSKGNRGVIWIGVDDHPQLSLLKKEINQHLRGLILPQEERSQLHVTLGSYSARLNPQRLGDYLSSLADYQSEPIEVTEFQLMRAQQTPKRIFYDTIELYSASLHTTCDD